MSLMFLLSIHSCRMRTYLDPVSRVIVLHPPVCLWCRPHLTRPPPRRLLFPQQRDLFFGHHPGELRIEWTALLTGSCPLQGLGQDGDHLPEAGILWCTCDFVVSKKGLMIESLAELSTWYPRFIFFFYWQYEAWSEWPLLPRPLILLPEAFWSEKSVCRQFNVLPHAAFLLLFPSSIVSCYSLQIQPFYSLPPPPPPRPTSPISLIHVFIYCVYVCVSMCRPNRY